MDKMMVRYGDVWFADLGIPVGSEQGGKRPVLIVSNDKYNRYSSCVNIVPLTSKDKTKIPTHVEIIDPCLTSVSIALIEKYRDIDKKRLEYMVGRVNREIMVEVSRAIEIQANMQKEFSRKKAFEILYHINKLQKTITEIGGNDTITLTKNYLIKEFKDYCGSYCMNWENVLREYKNNSQNFTKKSCENYSNVI